MEENVKIALRAFEVKAKQLQQRLIEECINTYDSLIDLAVLCENEAERNSIRRCNKLIREKIYESLTFYERNFEVCSTEIRNLNGSYATESFVNLQKEDLTPKFTTILREIGIILDSIPYNSKDEILNRKERNKLD